MIFQIAVLSYVFLTCWLASVQWRRRQISYRFFAVILMMHLPLVPITLQPDFTNHIANFFGIGRGADFLIYCAVLVIGRWLLALYQWNVKLESEITQLVRHLALSTVPPRQD